MIHKSKNFVDEFPMAVVFAIGGLLLFIKIWGGFWVALIGFVLGGIIGLMIDTNRNSR